jgi:hypothetical protein
VAGEPHADRERLDLLGRALPSSFAVRVCILEPGDRPYDAAECRNALVEVDRGEVDLEFCSGKAVRVRAGAVLWLCGLGLRALDNRGHVPVVLVALFGGRPDTRRAPSGTAFDEKCGGRRLNMHDDSRARPKA